MNNNLKKFILLFGDIGVLYLALYLTLLVRYMAQPTLPLWEAHFWPFTIVFIFWIIIFYISNLYSLNIAVNNAKFFQALGRSLFISSSLSIAFFYLIPQITIAPKRNMLIYVIVFAVLFFLWRQFFNWSLKAYLPKNNIAIIGLNNQVKELIYELKQKPHLGFNIAFVVDDKRGTKEINGVPVYDNIYFIQRLITKNHINNIVLTKDPHKSEELRTLLFKCLPLKINLISLPHFYETITGKIPIEAISEMWFLENLNEGNKTLFNALKRLYDSILAFIILLITIILWPIIGLIIKLESQGPAFFKQIRAGQNNKEFTMIKFRTMTTADNDYSPTEEKDFRITKFGSLLRKTRLDELPQMINILRGEMSFVGPRPERPELIEKLENQIPFYNERTLVKPGLTGWDQISGEYHSPTTEDSLKKLQYDLFYIKNRSVYLDLSIILKTIATVLSKGGR